MRDVDTAIVTVSDRRFLPAACCQLISTAANLPPRAAVQLFLVVCDVDDQDVDDARTFLSRRGLSVDVVVPPFLNEMMTPLATRWPRAAYLRLYFDWLFDTRWRRIIYFDADTRVCRSLGPLLNVDLRGRPVGAVHDFVYYVTGHISRRRRELLLADDAPYFQSGVMVFDWHEMLRCNGLANAREFLMTHVEACMEAPDQDALNASFEDRWTPLDPRWNLHETYLQFSNRLEPWLRHYTSTKPWSRHRPHAWREAAAWYQSELAASPWPDFVEHQTLVEAARSDARFAARKYGSRLWIPLAHYLPALLERMGWDMPWVPRSTTDVEDMAAAMIDEAAGSRPPLRPPEAVLDHLS